MTPVERTSLLCILFVSITAASAHAQSAEAEALFRDGRALIKAGKLADGCDKLAASERLETSVGTLLNLGDCNEKLGRTATAWAAFRKAEAQAKRASGDDKRMLEARRRATKLEPQLANLEIEVPHPVEGLVIKRNGEDLDRAMWGTAVPVDPGTYELVADAPGHESWRSTITIAAKDRRDIIVPELAVSAESVQPAVAIRHHRTWTSTRKFALGLAFVGAGAAAGGGIYFGVRAHDLQAKSDALCPTKQCNDPAALRLNDEAQSAATRSNIFLVAGGAVVAVATVLWFVGAPDHEVMVSPSVGDGHVGVSLARRF